MNAKQVLKGWAVRIAWIVAFTSFFAIGVSAEDSSTNVVPVADTSHCSLAGEVYTGLDPVESLEGTCLQEYTELTEHDIDRGLTASAARASEGETLLETLLAKAAQNNVTYVWDDDLVDQIEHDIDAGFVPVNAIVVNTVSPSRDFVPDQLPFDPVAQLEHDIDRGLTASATRASEGETLLETLLAKAAQNNITYVWDDDLIDQIEHDIDAGFIPVNAVEVNKVAPETSWYSSIPDTLPFDVVAMIGDLSLVGSAGPVAGVAAPVRSFPYTSLPTGLPIDLAEVLGY